MTLAGFHSLNLSMFELAKDYRQRGMAAYSQLQQRGGKSSTTAMSSSTETAQFSACKQPLMVAAE